MRHAGAMPGFLAGVGRVIEQRIAGEISHQTRRDYEIMLNWRMRNLRGATPADAVRTILALENAARVQETYRGGW